MTKIMVCLISGQHVPNLLSIKSESPVPDRLILIVTPLMKARDKHNQLLNALAAGIVMDQSMTLEISPKRIPSPKPMT